MYWSVLRSSEVYWEALSCYREELRYTIYIYTECYWGILRRIEVLHRRTKVYWNVLRCYWEEMSFFKEYRDSTDVLLRSTKKHLGCYLYMGQETSLSPQMLIDINTQPTIFLISMKYCCPNLFPNICLISSYKL